MAARRNQAPAKPQPGLYLLVALGAAGYGIYAGYPGLAALWAGLIACAWTYPPAVFSGKKDSRGYPTAASPGETASMNKYRFWEDLKFKLVLPNADWLPGFKPLLSFLVAVWAGAAAYLIPVSDPYTGEYGPWINAGAAFIVIAQTAGSRRRTQVSGDMNPGARVDSLIRLARKSPAKVAVLGFTGLGLGAAVGTAATVILPVVMEGTGFAPIPEPALWALFLTIGPIALVSRPWITEALEHWRIVVAAREEWEMRWMQLKQDPAPRLIDRREVGPATVDTFDAPPSIGAIGYWTMGPKITPTIGTGAKIAILSSENLDSQGQPVPGTRHPLRFDIVRWPSDQIPDITDPSVPQDVIGELMRCALVWAADSQGYGRPIFDAVHLLSKAPEPAEGEAASPAQAVWAVTWHLPDGPPPSHIRSALIGPIAENLNSEVLVDHTARGGLGCMYTGAISGPISWDPSAGVDDSALEKLRMEDQWDGRWIEVMKMGSNPPTVQPATARTAELANRVPIHSLSFVTRQGITPNDMFVFEPKMSTVMDAAPFTAMTGFPGEGRRPGERHPQAFTFYWADKAVPAKPDDLPPAPRSEAPKWVLAGRINEAFKAARLPERPEIVSALCLTDSKSRGHIWRIDLRLYGGVTLADVRGAAQKIRQSWGSEWLRVTPAKDGCTIVVGANPSRRTVKLSDPRHERYLADLDWEQAFLDAKISGLAGMLPKLTKVDHMPLNPQVKILEFDLTGTGLDFARMKEARATLEATSGNSFVEVRRVKDSATMIQILAAEVSPMPEHAPYDYPAIDAAKGIPFATGVEGEPVEFNLKDHIHLMVVGGSGSGKSVILQSLIVGAFIRGCDLYIADPTKGAADFTFAEPYAKAFCRDLLDTGAMMKGVYQEVKRRVALNTKHGVGSYRNLPEELRPRHIVVVLDEFTSLIAPDAVPKPSEDPEIEAERDMAMAINGAKAEVGAFTAKIAREARSAGVTLLLATQKLIQKDLDDMPGGSTLKVNLSRLIAGKSTHGERMSALKDAMSAPSMGDSIPPGRAIFEPVTSGPVLVQCWYDLREQAALTEYVGSHRQALPESEKLALTAYRRRLPGEDEQRDRIVDLGEIELDMGDLDLGEIELSLDDLGAAEAEPLNEEADPVEGAALFIDIDGVAAPFGRSDGQQSLSVPGHGTIGFDPSIVSTLARTPARQVFASSWDKDAPKYLGRLFPHTREFLTGTAQASGWWKIDSLLAWLQRNPGVNRIVWADDELAGEGSTPGVRFAEIARELLAGLGVEALLLIPDAMTGISREHLDEIQDFLGRPGLLPVHSAELSEPSWDEIVLEPLDGNRGPALPEPVWEDVVLEPVSAPAPVQIPALGIFDIPAPPEEEIGDFILEALPEPARVELPELLVEAEATELPELPDPAVETETVELPAPAELPELPMEPEVMELPELPELTVEEHVPPIVAEKLPLPAGEDLFPDEPGAAAEPAVPVLADEDLFTNPEPAAKKPVQTFADEDLFSEGPSVASAPAPFADGDLFLQEPAPAATVAAPVIPPASVDEDPFGESPAAPSPRRRTLTVPLDEDDPFA